MYEPRISVPSLAQGMERIVDLVRIWRAAMNRGANPRAELAAIVGQRQSPELVPACDSFFALTEACLGRPLVLASTGSIERTADEDALLETLRQIPTLLALGPNAAIPHGLPGALQWAAFAVLRALDQPAETVFSVGPPPSACPFARPGRSQVL